MSAPTTLERLEILSLQLHSQIESIAQLLREIDARRQAAETRTTSLPANKP